MVITPRDDLPLAFVVQSGRETYHCYLGSDPAFPKCSCPSWTYRERCRHVEAVKRFQEGK